jgi:hypothetical protein
VAVTFDGDPQLPLWELVERTARPALQRVTEGAAAEPDRRKGTRRSDCDIS